MSYRYDPGTRAYVAHLLFSGVPAYFRLADETPAGRNELRNLLKVLAAPLAIARQNIEELHGNLFIDTADDWVLKHLAEMVGTILVSPDADFNRRDIRSTVALRRRKGTPLMLEELGETLTGQMVVTQEGWKLVQMTQDLNLPRRERVIPDIRPAILAETESGPLCATHHLVDIRAISRTTGIFHPLHVAHWAHPTLLFPLEEGFPADLRDPLTDPDFRFAFHPLGEFQPLRAGRPSSSDRDVRTDRIPPMHFDTWPERWFDRRRRFSVKIGGVAAAVAAPLEQGRIPSNRVAGPELADGSVGITLLEHDPRRFQGPVRLEVAAVALAGNVPDTPTPASVDVRSRIELSAAGAANFAIVNAAAVDPTRIVMLRLQPVGAAAPFFPGAVVEIASDVDAAVLASEETESARQGFLRGALVVRVPASRVEADRWFVVSRDGSCYDAQSLGGGTPADIPVAVPAPGVRVVPRDRLLTTGPGSAWPPTLPSAEPDPWTRIPNAPGRGPLVLHGGQVLVPAGAGFADLAAGQACALVFALRVGVAVPQYRPFLRLAWAGPSPVGATWTAIDDAAAATALNPRLEEIAELRQERLDEARLLVRFECQQVDARLSPAEIAWSGYDGASILIYMPELTAAAVNPIPPWAAGPGIAGISQAAAIAADGSTWNEMLGFNLRQSQGAVAPLAEYATVRRRRVRYRRLCAWQNEVPPLLMLPATLAGNLDIDIDFGLFALAGNEAIRPYPLGPEGAPVPPSVTVMYQDGYTDRTGARPDSREPLIDRRLATPTRIISASGRLHDAAPSAWFALPRYRTLAAALADIAATPQPTEVVQFEDSATYPAEAITWPAGVDTLIVQAAERERPTVIVASWAIAPGASYDEFEMLGVSWSATANGVFACPPAAHVALRYTSILREGMTLQFDLTGAAEQDVVEVVRSVTAALELVGAGILRISDSVVDAGTAPATVALTATDGEIRLDRSTVFGAVNCRVIHASETIFLNTVTVTDRFRGCVRYSRVTGDSVLPRIHRIVEDVDVKFVDPEVDRHSAAHARLAADADRRILAGAEDGGEMGAFHDFRLALRYEGYRRRLEESTPAGLITGIIRLD